MNKTLTVLVCTLALPLSAMAASYDNTTFDTPAAAGPIDALAQIDMATLGSSVYIPQERAVAPTLGVAVPVYSPDTIFVAGNMPRDDDDDCDDGRTGGDDDDRCQPPAVPSPAAAWLFGSALIGLAGMRRRRNA